MGTARQADALLNLQNKLGRKWNEADVARYRRDVMAAPNSVVQAEFHQLNEKLGYNRQTAKCSDKQAALIRDLESQVLGAPVTDWTKFRHMTFDEADVRIKNLLAELAELKTNKEFQGIVGGVL
ncbi:MULTISPECIES: hypothetical protein [Microbacterium]|uniref:hypothetical protein n=1 Tax=Microbacterium TaxID=33882 RepID=UPI002786B1C9|nr:MULTISPECIES: hypothetical protein [Microbacterium]MDQ1083916.1 hypothetical protein [Microbacterium sp. SORGH_AS_0344]MDQ1170804.1 hypothetical protein [Microbacterium proteolyticum]